MMTPGMTVDWSRWMTLTPAEQEALRRKYRTAICALTGSPLPVSVSEHRAPVGSPKKIAVKSQPQRQLGLGHGGTKRDPA